MPRILSALRYGPQRVRLDLSRLTSIDAAGVGELMTAFNATKAAGGVMDITNARGPVRRILEVTGVYPLLTLCEAASAA
jgi:anti-anti-sigma factor